MTGISCVVALVVLALCLALLLPRAALSSAQLQLLKCLSLAAVNAIFAAYALVPVAKVRGMRLIFIKNKNLLSRLHYMAAAFFIALIPSGGGHSNTLPPTWSVLC